MKKLLLAILLILTVLVVKLWATATTETGDTRARPKVAYGTTSGGEIKPILVSSDGTVQTI